MMRFAILLPLLFLAGCVGGSPLSDEAGAYSTLGASSAHQKETQQARIDKALDATIAAEKTRGASEAEILLLQAQAEATMSAFGISQEQSVATIRADSFRRTQAALDRMGTMEAGGVQLQATQTHAAATVTAAYVDREASIGMAIGWTKVIVVLCLGVALSVLFLMLAKEIPPALRRRIDRSGIPVQEFRNGVAHQLPSGEFQIYLLPSGNGHREPPPINSWQHAAPPVPKAPGPVLHGDVLTADEAKRDRLRELALDLISASIDADKEKKEKGRDILGWREMGWSSEKWQTVKDALKQAELAWTDPGQGTHTGAHKDDDLTLDDVLFTLETDRNCLHAPPPPEDD